MAARGDTAAIIIGAARECLLADGYSRLSTRRVADLAGVPLSQIHYHFGGRQGLVLALLDAENAKLIDRQKEMYEADVPLWKRYEQACDFLDDDLASGYVRVLQEMLAAGWSDPVVAQRVSSMLQEWFVVLEGVATEAEARFGSLGPFSPAAVAGLIGLAFVGGESVILVSGTDWDERVRAWLRSIGSAIRTLEEPAGT
jgi:AcrR family transcriptional regulator